MMHRRHVDFPSLLFPKAMGKRGFLVLCPVLGATRKLAEKRVKIALFHKIHRSTPGDYPENPCPEAILLETPCGEKHACSRPITRKNAVITRVIGPKHARITRDSRVQTRVWGRLRTRSLAWGIFAPTGSMAVELGYNKSGDRLVTRPRMCPQPMWADSKSNLGVEPER